MSENTGLQHSGDARAQRRRARRLCCLRGILWGLLPLLLITAGAWLAARGGMEETLRHRAAAALREAGMTWAEVRMDGRDAVISGQAPSRAAVEHARALVADVPGVRLARAGTVDIRLAVPTVEPLRAAAAPVEIRGTWPAAPGLALVVRVAGRTYRAGRDSELAVRGDEWLLRLAELPGEGVHDVVVIVSDGTLERRDETRDELVIDTTPPSAPSLTRATVKNGILHLEGTWPAGDAKEFSVIVGTRRFSLGKSPALSAEGDRWRLRVPDMPEGRHAIRLRVADALGNAAEVPAGEVMVDRTPPPAPTLEQVTVSGDRAELSGTWPAGDATRLTVEVAGQRHDLGASSALHAQDGSWKLALTGLPEGRHDVLLEVADAAGNVRRVKKKAAVRVLGPPPASALRLERSRLAGGRVVLEGRWAEDRAVTLQARLAGRVWRLQKAGAFVHDGPGRWRLTVRALPPGEYDLTLIQRDATGRESRRTFRRAVVIPASPASPPEAQEGASAPAPRKDAAPQKTPTPEKEPAPEKKQAAPPPPPTVKPLKTRSRLPRIEGTWPADQATVLEVILNGRHYRPGYGTALRVQGRRWWLIPEEPLPDGRHDITVIVRGTGGAESRDTTRDEILIDATSPPAPTVRPLAAAAGEAVVLSGTWPHEEATRLAVTVNGRTYELGAPDGRLVSPAPGRWQLRLPHPLPPGQHEVIVRVEDALGNAALDQTRGELLIKAPPRIVRPAQLAEKEIRPGNLACQKRLNERLKTLRILFESDSDRLRPEGRRTLAEVARVLNTCPRTRVLIAGHTDSTGSATYNQALSERRAAAVARELVRNGVAARRLRAVGFGESRPVAGNDTPEGRARNRRIEFIVRPLAEDGASAPPSGGGAKR
jgi:outer membrane protein OmpA-like peptidoglycan-associated protein